VYLSVVFVTVGLQVLTERYIKEAYHIHNNMTHTDLTQTYKQALSDGYNNIMTPVPVEQEMAGAYLVVLETNHARTRWGVTVAKQADTASGLTFAHDDNDGGFFQNKVKAKAVFRSLVQQLQGTKGI
jgi:hypothetical protein